MGELNPEWEVTIGNVAFQARSALDQLIALAYKANGGEMAKYKGAFPIYALRDDYFVSKPGKENKREVLLRGIPDEIREVVDRVQPFNHAEPRRHLLAVVNAVCNNDKHRDGQPHLVAARSTAVTVHSPRANTVTIFSHPDVPRDLADDANLAQGDNLLRLFSEVQLDAIEQCLIKNGFIDDPDLFGIPEFRIGVVFGSNHVVSGQVRAALDYVETEVVGCIAPLIEALAAD
jgi:hypothetical protein